MTKRQLILEKIGGLLKEIPEIQSVEISKVSPVALENISVPACFVFSDNEVRIDPKTFDFETWEWMISIEVWARDIDVEELVGKIQEKMNSDYTLGGNAINCMRMGVDILALDVQKSLVAAVFDYQIIYRHQRAVS